MCGHCRIMLLLLMLRSIEWLAGLRPVSSSFHYRYLISYSSIISLVIPLHSFSDCCSVCRVVGLLALVLYRLQVGVV